MILSNLKKEVKKKYRNSLLFSWSVGLPELLKYSVGKYKKTTKTLWLKYYAETYQW